MNILQNPNLTVYKVGFFIYTTPICVQNSPIHKDIPAIYEYAVIFSWAVIINQQL